MKARGLDEGVILDDPDIEDNIIDRLTESFSAFNKIYQNIPRFRIPIGESEKAATTYYWIDSRIFPHNELHNRQMAIYEDILVEFRKKYAGE
jgi:hypothetical protein